MNIAEKKFSLYLTVLRFLAFKVTENLKRIYLDFDIDSNIMVLTAFYQIYPSELELELLDDIVTNSDAHIPDFFVESCVKLADELNEDEYKNMSSSCLQFIMNKAHRHDLKMLKFKKEFKNYSTSAGLPGNTNCLRSTGKLCSCYLCSSRFYKETGLKKQKFYAVKRELNEAIE